MWMVVPRQHRLGIRAADKAEQSRNEALVGKEEPCLFLAPTPALHWVQGPIKGSGGLGTAAAGILSGGALMK